MYSVTPQAWSLVSVKVEYSFIQVKNVWLNMFKYMIRYSLYIM